MGSCFSERRELKHILHMKNVPFNIFINGYHLNDKEAESENDTELFAII